MNGFCNVLNALWFRLLHRGNGAGNPLKNGPFCRKRAQSSGASFPKRLPCSKERIDRSPFPGSIARGKADTT